MKETKAKKIQDESVSAPNFTEKAIGCWKDPKTGFWTMFEVEVDPVMEVAGTVALRKLNPDRMLSIDEFKIYITEHQEIFKY